MRDLGVEAGETDELLRHQRFLVDVLNRMKYSNVTSNRHLGFPQRPSGVFFPSPGEAELQLRRFLQSGCAEMGLRAWIQPQGPRWSRCRHRPRSVFGGQASRSDLVTPPLVQVADSNGTTLLHVAARAGSYQVVKAGDAGP